MFETAKGDALFSLLLLFVVDILCLPLFFKCKKEFPEMKFCDILQKLFSKIGGKIIFIILLVFFFLKVLLTFSIAYVYLSQQVYLDDFFWIAIISIFPVVSHGVVKGVRTVARTIELFFVVIVTGFILCLFFSFFTPLSSLNLFTANFNEIISTSYRNIFAFGDFLILFLIIDKIQYKEKDKKVFYLYSLFAIILIFALFVLFYLKYPITSFMHNNALSDILVFSVKFNAIGRLDIIPMLTIMFFTIFQLEIFTFAFCDCFNNIFPKLSKVFSIVIFNIVFLINYYFFIGKYEVVVSSFSNILPIFAMINICFFPLVLYLGIILNKFFKNKKLKGKLNNEKDTLSNS